MAYKRKNRRLTEALTAYQETLDTQATALNAEQDVAADAVDTLELEVDADPGTELFDVEDVTGAVDDLVVTREQEVRDSTTTTTNIIAADADVDADSIALASDILANAEKVAQNQVDVLKSKYSNAVKLQQKLEAYKTVAEEINDSVIDFNAELAKFEVNSGEDDGDGLSFTAATEDVKASYTAEVEFKYGDAAVGTATLSFDDKGKLKIAVKAETTDTTTSNSALLTAFNESKGSAALVASFEALGGNVAKQENAQEAINTALINALKAEGFKPYEESAGSLELSTWDKALSYAPATGKATVKTGFSLNTAVKDGAAVAADNKAIAAELYNVGSIADTGAAIGQIDLTTVPALDGTAFPTEKADDKSDLGYETNLSSDAVEDLEDAKKDIKAFDKAVEAYNEAVDAQSELKDAAADVKTAAEAVAEAEKAFEGLGYNLVKVEDGIADGELYNENAEDQDADLFVYGGSEFTAENFDGNDKFYFGDKAADLIVVTKAQADSTAGKLGGEANVLDIFAYQDGANTILLVEKEAFAGNASGAAADNPDLVEVTLTGVNLADLSFEDGFITLA